MKMSIMLATTITTSKMFSQEPLKKFLKPYAKSFTTISNEKMIVNMIFNFSTI